MRKSDFERLMPNDSDALSCRCSQPDPVAADDAELEQLFRELAPTIFRLMDHDDADILTRFELQGQSPLEIAAQIGCSRAETARRLEHAQHCFCQLMVLTLVAAKPE